MSRYFIALDISTQSKQAIAQWRSEHLNEKINNAKAIPWANFHITLVFIGQLSSDSYNELIAALSKALPHGQHSQHELLLSHIGLFSKPKVLYIGLSDTPDWLSSLQQHIHDISQRFLEGPQHTKYLPHLSIYRKATSQPEFHTKLSMPLTIKSFSLYQSISSHSGVKYFPKKTWLMS
ncbi:RNA 2',3'-cyclic phosphodiesterase [Litorilituus lipolyticus]|uniref:RNA 2',3'-cyclic phosphodiesterase n=1 Tax=Litorilituus lipolyticus TaxID=2491017 RepID=A0A502KU86_9GAMM|nr:RNA 2',3'-cyclic phosphodiesterase [Litorilituus lipolyticus]TPH15046.1 RNA 2',3'-cyclic phosphodiesterase [Litorilituus lipolyticus]